MNMELMYFQRKAIDHLKEKMDEAPRDIIFKSPTGSGKTITLTTFMSEYLKEYPQTVFVWLTPGKGDLEEQSKEKMDIYIHGSHTKLLSDVMTSGFEAGDCCFVNWEKLTKKGNNALKDSERTNFLEWIQKALNERLAFKVIIDESHQNFTAKADEIIQYFHTNKIIRSSATPIEIKGAARVEVSESDVIDEGLIKRFIIINEDFPQKVETDNPTEYLLERGIEKQQKLKRLFLDKGRDINPLIIVQLPNSSDDSDKLLDSVEAFFEEKHKINYETGTLAVWLSEKKRNLEEIEVNNAKPVAIIIKQAIATGWDCPRAHILVKLRENMDETFEIQTIGRIRRMPEAHHYSDNELDSCYLFTFDSKFVQGVKESLGHEAFDSKTIFLKNEFKKFTLKKEQRPMVNDLRDPWKARDTICEYFKKTFNVFAGKEKKKLDENRGRFEINEFIFSDKIVQHTISGKVHDLNKVSERNEDDFNSIEFKEKLNTHDFGRAFHHCVAEIGKEIGMPYEDMRTIFRQLFCEEPDFDKKLLSLNVRESYAFAINNCDFLRRRCREAMSAELGQTTMTFSDNISEKDFTIPQSTMFLYDRASKIQTESEKNVYQGYLLSAKPRWMSERKFEKFCEENPSVEWIYKNGDKGEEYFSILYYDNFEKQKLFYPDYIVSIKGVTWIIETKGGFNEYGGSEDIDDFSPKKFTALKHYLEKHPELRGGFVRFDKETDELIIATEEYSKDVSSDSWMILKDFVKNL